MNTTETFCDGCGWASVNQRHADFKPAIAEAHFLASKYQRRFHVGYSATDRCWKVEAEPTSPQRVGGFFAND